MVSFDNSPLLWVSKIYTYIALSTLHDVYVALSHYVREFLPLKNLIKEVIDNLEIDNEKLKFVSSFTVYEDNNGSIVIEKVKGRLLHQITCMPNIISSGRISERNV